MNTRMCLRCYGAGTEGDRPCKRCRGAGRVGLVPCKQYGAPDPMCQHDWCLSQAREADEDASP